MSPSACDRRRALLLGLCLSALGLPEAHAEEEAPVPLEATSFQHRMAQGRFFLDGGQTARARDEFSAASKLPDGTRDPEVHELLARVRFQLGEVGGAVDAVQRAHALAGNEVGPELQALFEQLTTSFGKVLVLGAGLESARSPVPVSPIFDPELKRIFASARDRLEQGDENGSTSVWLPVGSYRVGSHIVEVSARRIARMDLRPHVGEAGGGVYGEVNPDAGSRRRKRGGKGRLPAPAPGLLLRGGVHGFGQQGEPSAGGRGLVMLDLGSPERRFVARVGMELGVQRAERVDAPDGSPTALLPAFIGGISPGFPLPGAGRLSLAILGSVGAAWVLPDSLPTGYSGPTRYLTLGPDIELRLEFAPPDQGGKVRAEPELAVRFLLRELRPMDAPAATDARPHLAVGGGLEFGVRFGEVSS